jgi:hypothetical protein
MAWAAPASAVGLALAPFFDRHYVSRGVLLCEGARWPRRLGWRYRAIAFGHVVLAVGELEPEVMDHELAHVGQHERWGVFLSPAYAGAAAFVKLRGGHHHRDNPFEIQARRKAPLIR